jgi:plastocyanin
MTTHDESPIIRTTKKRLAQGLAIIVIIGAVGTGIAVPFWNQMAATPPPASTIVIESPPATEEGGGEGGVQEGTEESQGGQTGGAAPSGEAGGAAAPAAAGTTITILSGSSVQGNPDYDPDSSDVPLNENIVWVNEDTVPHTATSGTGAEDPNSGQIFDTSIINGGQESSPVQLTGVKEGDEVPYYCQVHPYMTSMLTVGPAGAGAASNATGSTPGNASSASVGGGAENATTTTSALTAASNASTASTAGAPPATPAAATIKIPQGASVQGNPAYDPDSITVKAGDTIAVENEDSTPHTVTNGKDATDPNMGKLFDTSIINAGDSSEIVTTDLKPGEYPFFCSVHPYMTGSMTVQ